MIQKKIILNNKSIQYTLKKSKRARNLRLGISSEGEVSITLPFLVGVRKGEEFLREKAGWVLKKINEIENNHRKRLPQIPQNEHPKYRLKAYEFISSKLERYNRIYNFSYKRVSIRDQKTRWGSCSSGGNLNFNFKIIFLHDKLADYIIVHELCHLGELNHSKKFWALVKKAIPDYKEARKRLRRISL